MLSFLSLKKHKKNPDDNKSADDADIKASNSTSELFRHIESIHDLYTYQSQIGKGSSGCVYLAQSKQTSKQYALKRMTRSDKLNSFSFVNEVKVLKSLLHANIVNFIDAYISKQDYFVVTEYCSGGTLNERIMKMKRFSERDCVCFIQKILEAIHYIHSKHIVHRDLKLSNIVFNNSDMQQSKLKIIDFGESESITEPEKEDRNKIGSIMYLPPEANQYRQKKDLYAGDMWAIGVITYVLVEGAFPYRANNAQKLHKTPLKWNDNILISDSCKDFIQSLLHKSIHKRFTAHEALQHQWITNQAADVNLGDVYFARLQSLHFQNKLQKVMVKAVLHEMSETDKQSVLSPDLDKYEDDTQLINTILSSSGSANSAISSNDVKSITNMDKDSKAYKHTGDISDFSLDFMEIDDMLAEIEAESNINISISSDDNYNQTTMKQIKMITPFSPNTPSMDDIIPEDQFVHILQSSNKQYDIPAIVQQITDDGVGPITFRKIAAHHEPMDTLEDIGDWI